MMLSDSKPFSCVCDPSDDLISPLALQIFSSWMFNFHAGQKANTHFFGGSAVVAMATLRVDKEKLNSCRHRRQLEMDVPFILLFTFTCCS